MSSPTISTAVWRVTALALALLLAVAGCERRSGGDGAGGDTTTAAAGPRVRPDPGPAPAAATIAYTGNFRGFQKPCGCASKQDGGLFRLGTMVTHLSERFGGAAAEPPAGDDGAPAYELPEGLELPQPLWYVECGNFCDPLALYPAERARTYLKTLEHLIASGFKAAVPGSAELQLSEEQVREAFAGTGVPLVSCNLECDPNLLPVKPYQELAAGWYLTGVSSWKPASIEQPPGRWWELREPVAAVQGVLESLPADARLVVVAMYQPGEVIRALAELPVAVLIGHGAELDKQWTAGLAPAVVSPPAKGISLRLVSLAAGNTDRGAAATAWAIEVSDVWTDDPLVEELVAAERRTIKEKLRERLLSADGQGWKDVDWSSAEDFLPDKEGKWELYIEAPPAYLGSRECRVCHPSSYEVWKDTRHARALLSLVQHGDDETMDCLECHVTGLLEPSGFSPFAVDERVSGVTCESCHGPGSVHVGLMSLRRETDDAQIRPGSMADCVSCHDSYNSPNFELEEYWRVIEHVDRRLHRDE